jgi:hypothetical protein
MTATRTDYCDPTKLEQSDSSRWTVKNALQEHGWTVDHRAVRPGEDLDDYELIIVDANDPRGPKTQNHLGAMWATVQDWNGGPPVVINWDHWDIKRIWRGMIGEDYFNPSGPRDHASVPQEYLETFDYQTDLWAEGDWHPCMVCAFPWADAAKIAVKTNLEFDLLFDPSHDQPLKKELAMVKRRRVWVCGALTNHSDWVDSLELSWPVEYFGAASTTRLTRDDLLARYGDSWGVLSPKYYHTGSGYWRARIVHSAHMGCVLLCDPSEMPHWSYGVSPADIEELSDGDLQDLGRYQTEWLSEHVAERDVTIGKLGTFLDERAKRERHGEPLPKWGQETLL